MTLLFQAMVSGVAAGMVYGLIALGFSLIYRTSRVINFAQGDVALLAGYLAFTLIGVGMPVIPAGLIAIVGAALVAGIAERLVLRPLYRRPGVTAILATVGLAVVLHAGMRLIWGSVPHSLPAPVSTSPWKIAGVSITPLQVLMIVVGVMVAGVVTLAIARTRLGRAMRGCAQDPEAVVLFGVNVDAMYAVSFVLGSLVAGIAGVLIIPTLGLNPSAGFNLSVLGFSAAVLGGLGSVGGALVGGIVIGVVTNLVAVYISSGYSTGAAFVIMALILLIRVRGLFGDEIEAVREV